MADDLTPRARKQIDRIVDSMVEHNRRLRDLERAPQIPFSSIHGSVPIIGDDEKVKAIVGKQSDGTYTTKSVDGPVPAAPSQLVVEAGESAAAVSWDGRVVTGSVPADFKTLRIEAALDGSDVWLAKGVIPAPEGGSSNIGLHAGDWLVRGRVVSESGKVSAPGVAASVTIEPPVDADAIRADIDDAKQRLDEYRDEVAAPRFQALEDGLSENADNLADARERLSAAEQTLSPLPGQVQEARDFVEAAKEAAESAEARAVEASNNASNRLQNGGFELGLDHWDTTNVTLSNDAHTGAQAALIGAGGSLVPDASIPVSEGDVWDVSAYAKNGSALVVDVINSADNTVLESFTTSTASSWSETGRLRVEVPADVSYVNIRITGDGVLVDDVVLRDVTDVVRLERAATAARQTAEQAIAELAILQLAVDGEGGLKDRLASAETVLETKADEAVVDNVAAGLAGLSGLNTRTYIQDDEPPTPSGAVTYEWEGTPYESPSRMLDENGHIIARNLVHDPGFEQALDGVAFSNGIASPVRTQSENLVRSGQWAMRTRGNGQSTAVQYVYKNITGLTGGDWIAAAVYAYPTAGAAGQVRLSVGFAGGGPRQYVHLTPYIDARGGWHRLSGSAQIPEGYTSAWLMVYVADWNSGGLSDGSWHAHDDWQFATADTEEAALAQVETYFDGDTPNKAAETGLWIRGGQKYWYDHSTQQWVEVTDTGAFARLIANELFANLAVFDRLQAREGWIGGTLLADGAVTAEKITATRELITKIMGAEWAYIAEQLVVDGELIANHADVISAAIKNLSVTERADLFEAFITTLGAQEAVIDLLIGTEAWIGGTMLKDDTVTTRHIEFTETLVGNIAELLHLVVDQIDVNSLWADQTWQAAGHFGSEDADQKTEVDGTGVTLYRKIDGEFIPAAVFGGGDVRLAFFDDNNEATGAITQDGHVSGQEANFQQYHWQGRPLFGRALPEGNEPVFDSMSQRFIARNRRVMGQTNGTNQSEYGFLPLSFHAVAGMTYEIIVPGLHMWNIDQAVINAEIHYTTDGRPPVLSDPILGRSQWAVTTNVGTQKVVPQFTRFFHCEDGCEVNLLLAVRSENGNPVPTWWHSDRSEVSTAEMWVRPVGVTPPVTGGTRDVYVGHPDLGGGEKPYYTGWTPTWHQAYMDTSRYTGSSTRLLHGYDPANRRRYSTHFGGYRNSPAYSGNDDAGLTMNQALSGAFITDGTLTITGAVSTNSAGMVWVQWHTLTTAPTTFDPATSTLISSVQVSAGQQSVIDLPRVVLDAIAAGTFQGFTLHHPTHDGPWVSVHSQASTTRRLLMPMMRLRYVR